MQKNESKSPNTPTSDVPGGDGLLGSSLLKALLEAFPGIAMVSRKSSFVVVACNEPARLAGIEIGKTCYQGMFQAENPCRFCLAERLCESGERLQAEGEQSGRCWDAIWVPISDDLYIHFLRDTTEQKLLEESLYTSEERFRLIWENSPIGMGTLDLNGILVDCNQVLADKFGVPKKSIIGFNLRASGKNPGVLAAMDKAFSGEVALYEGEYFAEATGNVFEIRGILGPLISRKGTLKGVLFMAEDFTERKRVEEELRRAQKLEAIGTLAGGIAHDFNNLLQGVFGFLSMARLKIDQKGKTLEMLEQAEKALHLSVHLTSQLLTFSKGGKPLRKIFAIGPVVEDAAKFALSGSRADFRLDAGKGLWAVDADVGQISQVIQNIVLNADQAMPLGGTIQIRIRNHEVAGKNPLHLEIGHYAEVDIQDSGIGIPRKYLSKIFDPYFTTKEKGSGLGLATSYSIVKQHGGMIDVSSETGKGTIFSIYIPADRDGAGEFLQKETATPNRKGKVLLMDDEEIIRSVGREMLAALGNEVVCAEDGQEAVEKFLSARKSGQPFDAVILDLTIRGGFMGGAETILALRKIDPGVRAIVSSGYSENPILADFRAFGFAAFLGKPYKIEDLINSLDAALEK